jgi:hypothetical protein
VSFFYDKPVSAFYLCAGLLKATGRNCLPLHAVRLRGAAKPYSVLEGDRMIVPTLIMILAKGYDPNNPLILSKKPDVRSDLYNVSATFRRAFCRSKQSGPAFPMTKPSLVSDSAFTLTFRSPDYIVYIRRSIMFWHLFFLLF